MYEKIKTQSFPHTNLKYFTWNRLVNQIQINLQSTQCKKYDTNTFWWSKEIWQRKEPCSTKHRICVLEKSPNNNSVDTELPKIHSPQSWWLNCNTLEQLMELSRAYGVKSLSLGNLSVCLIWSLLDNFVNNITAIHEHPLSVMGILTHCKSVASCINFLD